MARTANNHNHAILVVTVSGSLWMDQTAIVQFSFKEFQSVVRVSVVTVSEYCTVHNSNTKGELRMNRQHYNRAMLI